MHSVRMGKKKNRNALSANAEDVREVRRRRRRGLSSEGARSFNAARGPGERCKLPSGSGRSQAANRHLVHFCLKMLYLARASMQLGVWERCKLSIGYGRSPAAKKRHSVHFWSENALSGKALNAATIQIQIKTYIAP